MSANQQQQQQSAPQQQQQRRHQPPASAVADAVRTLASPRSWQSSGPPVNARPRTSSEPTAQASNSAVPMGASSRRPRRSVKMKRNCEACTAAKVKCDGKHPCSRCRSRGVGHTCQFLPKKSRWDHGSDAGGGNGSVNASRSSKGSGRKSAARSHGNGNGNGNGNGRGHATDSSTSGTRDELQLHCDSSMYAARVGACR